MARVEGPLFSLAAHGTYGGQITYQGAPGQTIARARVTPYDPALPQQTVNRQAVRDAATAWRLLPAQDKAAWAESAAPIGLTGWSYFWEQWFAQGCTPGNPPVLPP